MTLILEETLSHLDWDVALPCTWRKLTYGCELEAQWSITCRACGGVVYRCDVHLAVERYRARTAPIVVCPDCNKPFNTHDGGLDAVAIIRHI